MKHLLSIFLLCLVGCSAPEDWKERDSSIEAYLYLQIRIENALDKPGLEFPSYNDPMMSVKKRKTEQVYDIDSFVDVGLLKRMRYKAIVSQESHHKWTLVDFKAIHK